MCVTDGKCKYPPWQLSTTITFLSGHRREPGFLGQIRERPVLRKTSTAVIAKERAGFLTGVKINKANIRYEEEDE
jgi:hypothetical protein